MSSGSMMLRQRSTMLRPPTRAATLPQHHMYEVGMLPRLPALAALPLVPYEHPKRLPS